MAAVKYNIYLEKGTTLKINIQLISGGTPFSLVGFECRMKARQTYESTAIPQLSLSSTDGGIVLGGELGTIDILVNAVDTASIVERGTGVYDIELVAPGDPEIVERLLQGKVIFSEEATKDDV